MKIPKKRFSSLKKEIVDRHLCTRCGVCIGVCPQSALESDEYSYPVLSGNCVSCGFCSVCCPGGAVDFPLLSEKLFNEEYDCLDLRGHAENRFVANAMDDQVRRAGTSGGVVTGILCSLLENGVIDGAVLVGMDEQKPYLARGVLAESIEAIKSCAQSKYCVTSSMEVLQELRKKEGRYAVVALPCQVHGLRKLESVDPVLSKKIACIFGLYCHCNMEKNGHLEALAACKINPETVASFEFRGGGWPGGFRAVKKNGKEVMLHPKILNKDVMSIMFRLYGPSRCYLCVDGSAEYADLSFGDFWAFDYPKEFASKRQCTLISQRTPRGLEVLKAAEKAGAISLSALPQGFKSKRTLSMIKEKKRSAFTRFVRHKKLGLAYPDYNFTIPPIGFNDRRNELVYRFSFLFRGQYSRRVILKILFSPVGVYIERLNAVRKNIFYSSRSKRFDL